MTTALLREAVLAAMQTTRISPNSKIMTNYKNSLPPLGLHLLGMCIGLMLGDASLQSNAAGTTHRLKFE